MFLEIALYLLLSFMPGQTGLETRANSLGVESAVIQTPARDTGGVIVSRGKIVAGGNCGKTCGGKT
jgi:hypothetical protein